MNYNGGAVAAAGGATTGGLALTGTNAVWAVLAGFALVAVGSALMRIAPKLRRRGRR